MPRRSGNPNYSGSVLQSQFRDSVREFSGMAWRIPDSTFLMGDGKVGSRKSPADFFVFVAKDSVVHICLCECKAESKKSIRFERLEPHQKDALVEIQELDPLCYGFVVVNFYGADVRKENRLFMVPVAVWCEWLEALEGERKSVPLNLFEQDERVIECPRVGTCWDVRPWFDSLRGRDERG